MNLHIIANFKLLHFAALALDELLEKERTNGVGSVTLLSISLDDHPSVYLRLMIVLMLRGVIGVDRMTHVR